MREKFLKKKTILTALLMIVIMSVFCGCGPADGEPENMGNDEEEIIEVVEEYVSEINRYETPDGVFACESEYIMTDKNFAARIVYPVTGNEKLDKDIESYVQELAAMCSNEVRQATGEFSEPAELKMEYTGYIADERFLGVKLTGYFNGPFMAHPQDIIRTFNGNTEGEILTDIGDVIAEERIEELCKMTADATGAEAELIDDAFLSNWNLTTRGLEITLERGRYGPMSDGTRDVLFTYAELGDMMAVRMSTDAVYGKDIVPIDPVEEPVAVPPAAEIDPEKPMVAITFDDGPGAYTDRLLDILQRYDAKATFFVVGYKIDRRPETVQRIVSEGHEIGGHSWNHKELTKLTEKEISSQLTKTRNKIHDVTGIEPVLMRPPYGSYNDSVRAVAKKLGISAINWNVDTLDWKYKDADKVYDGTFKKLKDGNIILFHDIHPTTVDAMERVIPALIEEGYQLVTVSQLLTADGGQITPGKLYYNR